MTLPGRSFVAGKTYRYGFNGKEKDLETTSTTTYDYGFRIYSPGLGRFLSVDPLASDYPWNSTYAFAENDVLRSVDIDGLEKYIVHNTSNKVENHPIISGESDGYRHMYLNPNKAEWDKGLVGYYDNKGAYTLLKDDSRLSDIDKGLLNDNLKNTDSKVTGYSIKLNDKSDIALKVLKQATTSSNKKPPKKPSDKEKSENATKENPHKLKKLDFDYKGIIEGTFYDGQGDRNLDGYMDNNGARNGTITPGPEDKTFRKRYMENSNFITLGILKEIGDKIKLDGTIKSATINVTMGKVQSEILANQANEAAIMNYAIDLKKYFSNYSGLKPAKVFVNVGLKYGNPAPQGSSTIKLKR
jgi:RHS repeat-associated protein